LTPAPGRSAGARTRSIATLLLGYWLPAAAYVALIFTASSIKGKDLPPLLPNMDKVAHLLEYSLLGLLLGRAIRFTMAGKGRVAASILTVVAGALIGAADELYQRGTPGRTCDIKDWIVDVTAVTLAVVFTQWASTRSLVGRAAAAKGDEAK